MKRLTQLATVAFLLTGALSARADVYKVDPAASTILWKGEKKLGDAHNGRVSIKEGQVEINEKKEVSSATVVADMKTLANDDLAAKPDTQNKLITHLSSPDFFDVQKYPTATFKLNVIEKRGTQHIAKGDLTILGKSLPVEFPVTFKVENGAAKGQGKLKVDRTRWGLKYGSGNLFKELTADRIINDEFELSFDIKAKKS